MSEIRPREYQEELSEVALAVLREHGLVYLAMEERTGKSLLAILVAEKTRVSRVLIITKKKALPDWVQLLADFEHAKMYTATNYHQVHKVTGTYDLVILDESHNYVSSFPKPSVMHKIVAGITKGKPIIYLSATPNAQSMALLYHQLKLSSWSPWLKYRSFYNWFSEYGIPDFIWVGQKQIARYKKTQVVRIREETGHLFVTKTRAALGFKHEPVDIVHYIELDEATRRAYNSLQKNKLHEFKAGLLVADTVAKLNSASHCLEGGTLIIEGEKHILENTEKIRFILDKWGDTDDLVIMYHYQAELPKLQNSFKQALLLQATSSAEGIDLAHKEHLVIYSQDYSAARHTQRRARQASMARETSICIHHLLVKRAMSERVFTSVVTNKTDFVDPVYQENTI